MIAYIEYLKTPTGIAIFLVGVFFVIQIIGELLEFKGKIVPEILKVRKYFKRKKSEREVLAKMPALMETFEAMPETLSQVKDLLNEVNQHYSKDNITQRDQWIKQVNDHIIESEEKRCAQDALMRELSEKLDKNNAVTLSISIENKRKTIIDFASYVITESNPVTREQFHHVFKLYDEYEDIIEENGFTNGEVDIAIRIIRESYEKHMKTHSFIEDIK